MTTVIAHTGYSDAAMSASATARSVYAVLAAGAVPESSDRYTEWALRFDQDVKRAEERLLNWSRNRAALVDDCMNAPSRETIVYAIRFARGLRHMVMDRVARPEAILLNLNGVSIGSDGEINFEFSTGSLAVTYRIANDHTMSQLVFRNDDLIHRETRPW